MEYHEGVKWARRGYDEREANRRGRALVDAMSDAFDDACVTGWQPLAGAYGSPDPDDEHLVAAAVVGGAGAIVSDNTRHMSANRLPQGIHVLTVPQSVSDTVSLAPAVAPAVVRTMVGRYLSRDCSRFG